VSALNAVATATVSDAQRETRAIARQVAGGSAAGPLADCLHLFRTLKKANLMTTSIDAHAAKVLGSKAALLAATSLPPAPSLNQEPFLHAAIVNVFLASQYRKDLLETIAQMKAASSSTFTPDERAFLAFIRAAIKAIDPNGDHCESQPGWPPYLQSCLELSRQLQLELIYPVPRTRVNYDEMEVAGVVSGGQIQSNCVVSVVAPGSRDKHGKVTLKAQVQEAR
jgi:hypothetical protein